MTCYRIDRTQVTKVQMLLWLREEQSGRTETETGAGFVVRVTLPEAPALIASLLADYSTAMTHLATDLACGGCTTCKGSRVVDDEPCPGCWERGRKRLSDRVFGIAR